MRRRAWLLLLAVPALVPALIFGVSYAGLAPSVDGAELPGGARLVRSLSNTYVLPAGAGAVLVDCGNDREARALKAELLRRGLDASSVKAVFLTHGHRDHLGGCAAFPGVPVYALAAEVPVIEGERTARGLVPRLRSPAKDLGVRVTHQVRDGETVTVGGLALTAYAVPGHTEGSAAWLAGGTLYLGDSAAVTAEGALQPAALLFSDDRAQNVASLRALARRLRDAGVQAVACGHSGPASGAALRPLETQPEP